MPAGKRKSPFIGLKEAGNNPILYQRYSKLSDILLDPEENSELTGEKSSKNSHLKRKRPDEGTGTRIENAYTNGHYNPDLESEQGLGNGTVEVSTKKTEKNKKQKQDSVDQKDVSGSFVKIGPNNIVPNGEAEELVIDTPDNRNEGKKGKKKKSSKKKTAPSGPSNAEEAQAMRGVLGFAQAKEDVNEKPTFGFKFGDTMVVEENTDASKNENAKTIEDANPIQPPQQDGNPTEREDVTDPKVRRIMGLPPLHVPRRIFVGGMPFHYEEDQVREYWSYCGEIEEVDLMRFPDTGRFKGIAFITFTEEAGYKEALKYNGEYIDNQQLKVEKCFASEKKEGKETSKQRQKRNDDPAPKTEGYNVAYVGNVAFDANREQLKEVFEGCRVTFIRLHTDKDTGKSKGFAHVHFEDEESLDKAMDYNGADLLGRRLKVGYAQPKKS